VLQGPALDGNQGTSKLKAPSVVTALWYQSNRKRQLFVVVFLQLSKQFR